ncbi:unnamed protein product, partial [Sphagnum troendelagicum]
MNIVFELFGELRVGGTLELNLGWSAHTAVVVLVKYAGGGREEEDETYKNWKVSAGAEKWLDVE